MNLGATTVSLGGAAAGTIILAVVVQRWWIKEGHKVPALIPYILAGFYGVLVVLCAGGLLGSAGHIVLWGGNTIGDAGLVYGVGGHTHNATSHRIVPLTDGGYVMVLLATALLIGALKWSKKIPKAKVVLGSTTGILLGLNAGVAGALAVPLANFANLSGAWWAGGVQ
ncbi:hypothetical protein FCH28_09685 [Streptomyces piniterrae]|uniref:Uncharacterized protein n=1 Tax=Streptomyces piniterrae TaxID=2571125 RepID=A0A4U0NMT7_9ACTN|nr:hypothetical protein [Streptomyces piniterrae]TJZ55600.1 hypothetical protein FCH28_09685 [Streptomyces piniterrae]